MTTPNLPGMTPPPEMLFTLDDGTPITQSAVRAAGRRIRKEQEREGDREVVNGYRRLFQYPQGKVWMGLRSFARTVGISDEDSVLTGRLKRYDRIITKLRRYPSMPLTSMQDIGGCRLVVPTLIEQGRIVDRVLSQWEPPEGQVYDYREGKVSGYRAVHVVVERDGRLIECQIRTQIQQWWADQVEAWGRRTGQELKWDAPDQDEDPLAPVRASFRGLGDKAAERDRLIAEALERGLGIPEVYRSVEPHIREGGDA